MNAKLQDQLNRLTTPPSANHCFNVQESKWVEFPHQDFLDSDFHLPSLQLLESGYRSVNLVVLTTRPTVYGPTIEACIGYVKAPLDTEELDDYQYSLEWHSDDGETVVGWMPIPVFHVDETTIAKPDTTLDNGFYFGYSV